MMLWRRILVRRATDLHRRLASTLVLAEHDGGGLKAATLSAVSAAKHLDESGKVSLLLAGCGSSLRVAAELAASSYPSLTEVLVAESESLEHGLAEPWAELIFSAQQKGGYSHVIAVSNSFGKNVLPRAAALFDVSPIADVIQILDDRTFVRPIYAGNALCKIHYKGKGPCLLTVRPTAFPATSGSSSVSKSPPAPIKSFDVTGLCQVGSSTWIDQSCQQSERPELGTAKVVVAGGRALKNSENFQMLETLADKLGGAVGATRAAVDAGYVPNDLQVGQTGKVVAPELYLAIGISGAIQHLAGMKDSKVIVAINKDADAPIFKVADYGLVADLFQAIPELIEKLPESSTTNKDL